VTNATKFLERRGYAAGEKNRLLRGICASEGVYCTEYVLYNVAKHCFYEVQQNCSLLNNFLFQILLRQTVINVEAVRRMHLAISSSSDDKCPCCQSIFYLALRINIFAQFCMAVRGKTEEEVQ
jgi:hypothetical protein